METNHNGITYQYPTDYAARLATLLATLARPAFRGAETEANGGPVQSQTPRPHGWQVVSMADGTAVRGTAVKSAPVDQAGARVKGVKPVRLTPL